MHPISNIIVPEGSLHVNENISYGIHSCKNIACTISTGYIMC